MPQHDYPPEGINLVKVSEMVKMAPLLVLFVGLIGSTAVSQYQIGQHEKELDDLKEFQEKSVRFEERQTAIKEDITEVKDDVKKINGNVQEVKNLLIEYMRQSSQ